MTRENYSLLFLLAAALLLSTFYIPAYNPLLGDKEIYRYVGQLIGKGGLPYRDVFDHKPPLIFVLYWASLLIGNWGLWLIDTIITLLATGLFFRVARKYRLPFPWLLPLLFNLMLRDHLICYGMGMTREYTALLMLLFFCVLMSRQKQRFFFLGFLCGLTFFMQQDQVLQLIPFFFYAFRSRDKQPLFRRIFSTGIGFLSVALPVIVYFAVNHALGWFWRDAFAFNFGWYTTAMKESLGDHLRHAKHVLDYGNYEPVALVSVILGLCALYFRNRNKPLVLAALIAAFLSVSPEFMGGRSAASDFTHYYLPLAATLPILLFCVFAFTDAPLLQDPAAMAVYGFLVCASLTYTALQHGTHLVPAKNDISVTTPPMQYLRQHRPGDYQYYNFGNIIFDHAYNEFGILAPSPWVYQHFWKLFTQWDEDHTILHSIGQDLLRHRTTFIMDNSDHEPAFLDTAAASWWHAFLRENYQPVIVCDSNRVTLWKYKGAP
jgi:hypothetical protein